MDAPFYKYGAFSSDASLLAAFLIGGAFGFFLERAGFGSARKLAAQFYGRDMAVLKVMFTAIITAMVGLTLLSQAGVVDLAQVSLKDTRLTANLVGGLVLGVGFVIGGYCPGTSMVAAATGRIDALVYIGGMFAGMIAFGFAYPVFQPLVESSSLGAVTLPAFFHVPYGVLVLGVCLMAVGMFLAGEWAEMRFGGVSRAQQPLVGGRGLTPARMVVGLVVAGGVVAALAGDPYRGATVTVRRDELAIQVQTQADHIQAVDLADRLIAGRNELRILDLRDAAAFAAYHIPGAEHLPLTQAASANLPADDAYLLYSDGGIHGAQAWMLLKARGLPRVYSLYGGLEAWKDDVLYPVLPEDPAQAAKRRLVSEHFGGRPRGVGAAAPAAPVVLPPPPPPTQAPAAPPAKKKREGC